MRAGDNSDQNRGRLLICIEAAVLFLEPGRYPELGTKHPKHEFVYEVNYGCIPVVKAADGEDLDAYYLGVDKPLAKADGSCIGIVHRLDDDDDKLVVVPEGVEMTDEEIMKAVNFQEKWFKSEIRRA